MSRVRVCWELSRGLFVPVFAAHAANVLELRDTGVRRAHLPTSGLSNRSVGLFTSPQCAALMIGWLFFAHGFCALLGQQRQSECPGSRTIVKIAKWFQLGMFECLVGVSFCGVPTALRCRALLLRGCMMSFLKFDSARFR